MREWRPERIEKLTNESFQEKKSMKECKKDRMKAREIRGMGGRKNDTVVSMWEYNYERKEEWETESTKVWKPDNMEASKRESF